MRMLPALAAVTVLFAASPAQAAAPSLKLSATSGVKVGQTITVTSLTGLAANLPSVAIGQCKPNVTGTSDCNLTGSLLGQADASGKWTPGAKGSTITLVKSIGGVDCTAKSGACIIGVTSLVNPTNVLARVPLTFSSGGSSATPAPTSSSSPGTSLPMTGSPDGIPTFALAASALVLACGALLFLLPSRRRTH